MKLAINAMYILAFILMIMWLLESKTYEAGIVLLYGSINLIGDLKAVQMRS